MSFEHLFSSSTLSLVVPDTSLEFPPNTQTDDWLSRLSSSSIDRKQAFFDEQLQSILTLRIEHPDPLSPADPTHPPESLLSFLTHVQISLEATYITPLPQNHVPDPRHSSLLSAPPRSTAGFSPKPSGRLTAHHPSIFPPATPNPTPAAGDHDRKYLQSEGTLLLASIWGLNTAEDSPEAFALLWSEEEDRWVAVYRLGLTVSYLRLNFMEPLLCLTISATLREKAVVTGTTKNALAHFITSIGKQKIIDPGSPTTPKDSTPERNSKDDEDDRDSLLDGLEEVNLLDGLYGGSSVPPATPSLQLPTTRLGTVSRLRLFSLPPVALPTPTQPSPSPLTAIRKAHPTLRKSYRKTMSTVSGLRVRMRSVWVPSVLLDEDEVGDSDEDDEGEDVESKARKDEGKERERREAGAEERTVVLCVEVENSGEAGQSVTFEVEKVVVGVGGEGASAKLIGWGDADGQRSRKKGRKSGVGQDTSVFPLKIGSLAQVNLLYAVTFLRSPEETDAFAFSLAGARNSTSTALGGESAEQQMQRAVAINIFGRPFSLPSSSTDPSTLSSSKSYPTPTFSSKWNCVLDLSSSSLSQPRGMQDDDGPSILPEPASPFPIFTLKSAASGAGTGTASPGGAGYSAGSTTPQTSNKRHTFAGLPVMAGRALKSSTPSRASASFLHPAPGIGVHREGSPVSSPISGNSNTTGSRMSTYLPPSASRDYLRSPTTYSAPPPPPPPRADSPPLYQNSQQNQSLSLSALYDSATTGVPPMTPAYPAFPPRSSMPQTPISMGPVSQPQGAVGPSVEIRRERGVGSGTGVPPTPGPFVPSGFGDQQQTGMGMLNLAIPKAGEAKGVGDSVVVSVGLLDVGRGGKGAGKIYPLDVFTLDIFVYNQSGWVRRFEVSCAKGKRKRGGEGSSGGEGRYDVGYGAKKSGGYGYGHDYPGVVPIDSRVRIGPLRPSSCQSVRMDFLALAPGVHSIEALTLTDVETRFTVNLRSVMDVVVHDPND